MLHSEWPLWLRCLLMLHIASGVVAFLCAPIALLTKKGGRNHRYWGKIYFWAMTGVAASAITLSFALPIWFLAMVSVFSFYAAFSAYRILSLKDLARGGKAAGYDWGAATLTVLSSALLFVMGFLRPHEMGVGVILLGGMAISIVSVVFGLIGMQLGFSSMRRFGKRPDDPFFWWFDHMQGMIASYIAAMTAFSAVNLSHWFGAAWWVWLWPTMLGVPGIRIWSSYYHKKFAARRSKIAV